MACKVIYTKLASKQMKRAPDYITAKLLNWANEVEVFGIETVRRHPGYHDEPLMGKRIEQRSIRLSRQWRAIYCEKRNGAIWIYVLEVTPHDYKTR